MKIKRGIYRCDVCEQLNTPYGFPQGHIHFKKRDFTICLFCLVDLAEKHIPSDKLISMGLNMEAEQKEESNYIKEYIPSKLKWQVWERDNYTCQICGSRKNLSVDHILAESKGGKLKLDNLQTLCRSCNSRKGNKINK